MQHNQVVVTNEERIAAKARMGLELVAAGERDTMAGWLLYGEALNEGRELFPSNEEFGRWVCDNLPQTERHDRAAAMWAAANPEDYKATRKANPQVRTVRGLHAKWKNPAPTSKPTPPTHPELTMMRKLKALVDHPTTDEGTRENVRKKLDKYLEDFGITEGSLVEPETKPNAVGMTRREMKHAIANTILRNAHNSIAASFIRAALEGAYTDDELEFTLNLVKERFQ